MPEDVNSLMAPCRPRDYEKPTTESRLSHATPMRHRLAAILAADASGYSRLMADDEQATVAALDKAREVFRAAAQAGNGRIVDTAGDSVLALFETAAGAASAALQIQQVLQHISEKEASNPRLCFRIGVHLGDVLEKDDGSIYGDGVNIAARLQSLAPPDGIVVSDAIRTSIGSRLSATFLDLGNKSVKNMTEPVHAFAMTPAITGPTRRQRRAGSGQSDGFQRGVAQALAAMPFGARRALVGAIGVILFGILGIASWMRSQPPAVVMKSIAVLPFVDMSEKHDQEYFSDGLSEELIDKLANAPELKVIARTSSFQFKGKNEDMRTIAEKLGVANLLEGSVRKSGDRVRITAQLIRAQDGFHVWSQIYERDFSDIFKVQGEIAGTVARSLRVAMQPRAPGDMERPNTEAYNLRLEGDFFLRRTTKRDTEHAISLYKRALALDPNYARAWSSLADAYGFLGFTGLADLDGQRDAIAQALRADPNLAAAYVAQGFMLKYYDWDWLGAEAAYRRAGELNDRRSDDGLASIGWMFGRIDESIAAHRRSLERDPLSADSYWGLGLDLFVLGRQKEAENAFLKVSELNPSYASAKALLGLVLLSEGRGAEALISVDQEQDAAWKANALPIVYWGLGRPKDSDAALQYLKQAYSASGAYQVAEAHAYRGELDTSFEWLDRAYRQRDPGMTWIRVDPLLQNLRQDPRYHAFLVKMKLDAER